MKLVFQTIWTSLRCICSKSAARNIIFSDDAPARRQAFSSPLRLPLP